MNYLFPIDRYKNMARRLAKSPHVTLGNFAFGRYANGELNIRLKQAVKGKSCVILGSLTDPDEQLFEVLLLAHTLKKEGARRVTALLPYLGYARQDKDKRGESRATQLMGSILKTAGVDRVITIDTHSRLDKKLYSIPLISVPTQGFFLERVKHKLFEGATIVSPDEGAIERCEKLRRLARIKKPLVYFDKKRTVEKISLTHMHGRAGKKVIIYDDILDTGNTLLAAAKSLSKNGVEEIHVMVSHALFTGVAWKKLKEYNVKRIYTTNTSSAKPSKNRFVMEYDISELLARVLK